MSEGCPRVATKEQMLELLQSGGSIHVVRKDAPELPELLEWEREGLVVSVLVEIDDQSSELVFRWKDSVLLGGKNAKLPDNQT